MGTVQSWFEFMLIDLPGLSERISYRSRDGHSVLLIGPEVKKKKKIEQIEKPETGTSPRKILEQLIL